MLCIRLHSRMHTVGRVHMVRVHTGAVSEKTAQNMAHHLMASPLLAQSPLKGGFQASRGLAFTFTHDGIPELTRRFPELDAFLSWALSRQPTFLPFPLNWLFPRRAPNAFYLNLLLLGPEGAVSKHVDGTLRQVSGLPALLPEFVSVLYLQTPPEDGGGELVLSSGNKEVARIKPQTGMGVHFRGDLLHEVTVLRHSLRVSLVCEQYAVPDEALKRIPSLLLHSKAPFSAHLMAQSENKPNVTYHLVPQEEFDEGAAEYLPGKFSEEGFVHTTRRREHVHVVANRYYQNDPRPYLLLTIDLNQFAGPWRYDDATEEYPHLYAPIPARAIVRAETVARAATGAFKPFD